MVNCIFNIVKFIGSDQVSLSRSLYLEKYVCNVKIFDGLKLHIKNNARIYLEVARNHINGRTKRPKITPTKLYPQSALGHTSNPQ